MTNQLQEYVLDLLPPEERAGLERAAARDETLRLALRQEREVGRLVRATLQETTAPAYGRIPQLMPAVPRQRPYPWPSLTWQRSVAALALVLVLFLGSAGLYQSRQAGMTNATPTLMAATATLTQEPTATLAQLGAVDGNRLSVISNQCSLFSGPCSVAGTVVAQPAPEIQATPALPTVRLPITSN
ncbi:MAG: hypothetical protein HF973_03105 [Chloroflexi bacterium]|nr:hypothetical protein [Chloroflexota bacterium]